MADRTRFALSSLQPCDQARRSTLMLLASLGLLLLATNCATCREPSNTLDKGTTAQHRARLWNLITSGDPDVAPEKDQRPVYEGWNLFPGPPGQPNAFLNKRLGLPVHGRWVTVRVNTVAENHIAQYMDRVRSGNGEVPEADLPAGSIIVKLNYGNVQKENIIAQAPEPAVLTVAYKVGGGFCQTGVRYNGKDCLGGEWLWAFFGLEGEVDGVVLPREALNAPVADNTEAFCVNCHNPGRRTEYLRGLQRLAEEAAHNKRPTAEPEAPPQTSKGDPFCEDITLTPTLPGDVALDPAKVGLDLDDDARRARRQKMFDCFAWRSFIALNWPAQAGVRGAPDTKKGLGDITNGVDTVWETYKATWEVFQPENPKWDPTQAKNPAGRWDAPRAIPSQCPQDTNLAVLANITKTSSRFPDTANESGQAFAGSFGTLTDRNGNRVRYQVLFNEASFNTVLPHAATRLLSPAGPNNGQRLEMPEGAIEIKSSWKELCREATCAPVDDPARYYSREVFLYDAEKKTCRRTAVGLVGLHIATKTFWAPQWIWATFEHKDNAPSGVSDSNRFSFYDPKCQSSNGFVFAACSTQPFLAPKTVSGRPAADPCCPNGELNRFKGFGLGNQPNQVTRLDPMGSSRLNALFTEKIQTETDGRSPLSNYALVNTQWPLNGRRPAKSGPLPVNRRLCSSQREIASDPLRPIKNHPDDCYTMVPTFLRNTSMETYMATYVEKGADAIQVSNRSCMGCHAAGNDFSYVWLDAVEQVVCVDDPANGCVCENGKPVCAP